MFTVRLIPKDAIINVRKQLTSAGNPRYRYTHKRKELSQYNLINLEKFNLKYGRSMNAKDIKTVKDMWKSKLC